MYKPLSDLPGQLVQLTGRSGFKVAAVVGPSRNPDKLRVKTYSRNSRRWSGARPVPRVGVVEVVVAALPPAHRMTVRRALSDGKNVRAWARDS